MLVGRAVVLAVAGGCGLAPLAGVISTLATGTGSTTTLALPTFPSAVAVTVVTRCREALLEQQPASIPALDIVVDDFELRGKKLGRVVMMREAPDHVPDDFIALSGTKVRQMLGAGIAPPPEFSRPEVAKVLMEYYQIVDSKKA